MLTVASPVPAPDGESLERQTGSHSMIFSFMADAGPTSDGRSDVRLG
jgi:hypothetical protein